MSVPANTPAAAPYWRAVNNRQWQNAANIRGCSVHSVRLDHDSGYRAVHTPKPVSSTSEPEDWIVNVQRRIRSLPMTYADFAALTNRNASSFASAMQGVWRMSDKTKAAIERDLSAIEAVWTPDAEVSA